MKRVIIPVCAVILTLLLCVFPADVSEAALASLTLWAKSVAPVLLPFMIMVNLLNAVGALSFVPPALAPVALGLIGGYPIGAKICADMTKRGELSVEDAPRLAASSSLCGPMFIIGAAGVGVFGSAKTGFLILASHWFSVLAVSVFTKKPRPAFAPPHIISMPQTQLGKALSASVARACESVIKVGGYIVLFGVFSKLTSKLLHSDSIYITAITGGLLEMTNGVFALYKADPRFAVPITAFLVSFGGFCVIAQCAGFLSEAGIKPAPFVLYKLTHGVIAALCALALFPLVSA